MSFIVKDVEKACVELLSGEAVAIPTETVYGLAAVINNELAIKKIYHLKKRPLNHPLIMHVAQDTDLSLWVDFVPDYALKLIKKFWPGPLTLVLPCKSKKIHSLINNNQDTVAIRCPDHEITQQLLKKIKIPVVAPSANKFGKLSPTTAEFVANNFAQENLMILDGGRCTVGIESTIVLARDLQNWQILRQGAISEAQINFLLTNSDKPEALTVDKSKKYSSHLLKNKNYDKIPQVSGSLLQHYQPEKKLFYYNNPQMVQNFFQNTQDLIYILFFNKINHLMSRLYYQLPKKASAAAYELYFQLQIADNSAAKIILIEEPPNLPEWQGIRERIFKAGTKLDG